MYCFVHASWKVTLIESLYLEKKKKGRISVYIDKGIISKPRLKKKIKVNRSVYCMLPFLKGKKNPDGYREIC